MSLGRPDGGHGDPFPLPPVSVVAYDRSSVPRYLAKRLGRRRARDVRVAEAVFSLNAMARRTTRGGSPSSRPAAASSSSSAPSASQRAVVERLARSVALYGDRPVDLDPRGALLELLRTESLYDNPPCKVVDYNPEKLKVLSADFSPQPITAVAPEEVRQAFADPDRFIRRSDEELAAAAADSVPIKPYWDVSLATNRAVRIDFIRALASRGLVSFRRRIRARVGCFFVGKKDGRIRLVVDARESSRTHSAPPHVALGTPAALAEQDWSSSALAAVGVPAGVAP